MTEITEEEARNMYKYQAASMKMAHRSTKKMGG
jgi:hypothetical protein